MPHLPKVSLYSSRTHEVFRDPRSETLKSKQGLVRRKGSGEPRQIKYHKMLSLHQFFQTRCTWNVGMVCALDLAGMFSSSLVLILVERKKENES
jgi:hypothetical protein